MAFLRTVRLVACLQLMTVVAVGSTVARDGAILLDEQTFNETVALGSAETPSFKHFFISVGGSPLASGIDAFAAPFEIPSVTKGFAGSFILDATSPERSTFASLLANAISQHNSGGLRMHVGLSGDENPFSSTRPGKPGAVNLFDSRFPERDLAFVRFDINDWEVAAGIVSYNIKLSYWGKPASGGKALPLHSSITTASAAAN